MTAIFKSMCLWFSYLKLPGQAEYNHKFHVLCSQSLAPGCRECEVELSRVCHDVTQRSVTEMETVTRTGHLETWTLPPRPSLIAPHFSRFVVDKEGAEGRHKEALQGHHWRLCSLSVLQHRLISSHQFQYWRNGFSGLLL